MIKILLIHSSAELYGSDRSLLNIIRHIDKNKYEIHVMLPCEGPLAVEIRKIEKTKIEIYDVAVLRRKNLSIKGGISYFMQCRKSIKYISEFIDRQRIDIVYTNTAVIFPGAIAAKKRKIKSVWHIREIITNKLENRIISFVMNKYADIIIANSRATGSSLKIKDSKVRVVYNAVEIEGDTDKIPQDKTIVAMAGRINRWKGQKLFVDAAELVHRAAPDVLFWIAGDVYIGENYIKEDLTDYIEKKGLKDSVILLGQVNDMSSFYKSIDIFVLPSVKPEPFGLVIIEAMSYGIPVIATNHGGPTEIIDNGINGYLVDYEEPEQMAERIIEMIGNDNKRKQIGEAGRSKRLDSFTVSTMVRGIEEIFREVML